MRTDAVLVAERVAAPPAGGSRAVELERAGRRLVRRLLKRAPAKR